MICYYNCRSLLPKIDCLRAVCASVCPAVVCLVETWLSSEILDSELYIPQYSLLRLDRNRHGGGLSLFLHSSVTHSVVLSGPSGLEFVLVTLIRHHLTLNLGVFYRPPSSSTSIFDTLTDALLTINQSLLSNLVILGDFNVNFTPSSYMYAHLQEFMSTFSLSQLVTSPTRYTTSGVPSTIDLVLTSNSAIVSQCSTIPELLNSDHLGLSVTLRQSQTICSEIPIKRKIWCYSSADFNRSCDLLRMIEWDEEFCTQNVSDCISTWTSLFLQVMEMSIPYRTSSVKRTLPWITREVLKAIQKRNMLFNKAKRSKLPADERKYKSQRNHTLSVLRQSKKKFFNNLNSDNSKVFWKSVKALGKRDQSIPTLEVNGQKLEGSKDKAEALNLYFHSCFNRSCSPLQVDSLGNLFCHLNPCDCPQDLLCSVSELEMLLGKLNVNKSSGVDGISPKMLKATAMTIAPTLCKLFNASIRNGEFPVPWKLARVVPIPKAGNQASLSNYRPISILPTVSKLLEKHIKSLLVEHFSEEAPITPRQWGFMNSRSAQSALIQVIDDWCKSIDNNHEVAVVFFDVRKAFDSVPHVCLLELLYSLNVNEFLIRWIKSYLLDRRQQVVVNGQESHPREVISGVPQGSVLGPLLFIAYINGLAGKISPGTLVNLFADDIVMYKVIKSSGDYKGLQEDIFGVSSFMGNQYLQLNATKCKFMLITKRRSHSIHPPPLILDNSVLQRVYSYKYLGLTFSADLSWRPHISAVSKKSKRLVGLVYRRFSAHASSEALVMLYKSFVRPHLEYASAAWCPYHRGEIQLLESVQKFALKVCLKAWDHSMSYNDMLESSGVCSLEHRRMVGRVSHLFKILNNLTHFPTNDIQPKDTTYKTRQQNSHSLKPIICRTLAYKNSFVPATVELWNKLVTVVDIKQCASVRTLKLILLIHSDFIRADTY